MSQRPPGRARTWFIAALMFCLIVRAVKDREKVARRNATPAVVRIQQDGADGQQYVTGNAGVDACLGPASGAGITGTQTRKHETIV